MATIATAARVDDDDVLRIRWAEPPRDEVLLELRHENARAEAGEIIPADWEPADAMSRLDLAGLDLADGTWEVRLTGRDIITTDPGFSLDGLAGYARRPRTRAVHAFRAPSGGLRLAVRTVEPYAEATAVHPDGGRIVMEGYFAFGDPRPVEQITATRRKTKETVTGEAVTQGERWRAELAIEPFRAESGRGYWDLQLDDLTLATHLDDIAGKKERVRFPAQFIERSADRVRIRPYYTDSDHLAVAATVVSEGT